MRLRFKRLRTIVAAGFVILGLASGTANADVEVCLRGVGTLDGGTENIALEGMKVWHGWFGVEMSLTDLNGCVTIAGEAPVSFKVQAENEVVAVLDGIGVAERTEYWFGGGEFVLGEHYYLAQKLKEMYFDGLAGAGPFGIDRPMPGPYVITAVIDSFLTPGAAYVEPSPTAGTALPRIHLNPLNQTGERTLRHELGHALVMAQMDIGERDAYQLEYVADLVLSPGWTLTDHESPLVAWVEAFGVFAETFGNSQIRGREGSFFRQWNLLEPVGPFNIFGAGYSRPQIVGFANNSAWWGDDVVGAVYSVLFLDYASRIGLDFVINRYIDCGAHNLQGFAMCIANRYGQNSPEFSELMGSMAQFGIPVHGFWSLCTEADPCSSGFGDCDNDAQCAGSRVCRNDGGPLMDICVSIWSYCSIDFPCERGEGDCDVDEDCNGFLYCRQQSGVDTCETPPLPIITFP